MRKITISVLSLCIACSAFGNARLPVVNVSAGSVSARAAFGEEPTTIAKTKTSVAPTHRRLVARPAVVANTKSPEKTTVIADVLVPNRPSTDLWVKTDTPLRMPRADEFSVISSNYVLPEESLDSAPRVANATNYSDDRAELDAQIAKLVELQRQADESVQAPAPIKISRVVVPMDAPTVMDAVARPVEQKTTARVASTRSDMSKMSPTELRKAFKKTFLSENKHLSTYPIDDRFDVASDMSASSEGFTAHRDLSEGSAIRTLEIKIAFRDDDSALSRENYNLLSEYATIAVSNPKRAIQVAIPERATRSSDGRKLAARRLAIVEQVLRDTGVAEQRIMPVLASRDDDSFVLRIISGDQYETMTQKRRNMFGDTVGKKTYKSMTW